MAVRRGTWSKEQVWNKILESFPGAFVNEKEIRIPMIENGERIEIKVTLTAAQTNVGDNENAETQVESGVEATVAAPNEVLPPTEEEKKQVNNLLSMLGL